MNWSRERSAGRIRSLMESVPTEAINIQDFEADYLPRRSQLIAEARSSGLAVGNNPILSLPYNRAVVADGVHVYANLLKFNDYLTDTRAETERAQKNSFQFLHLHYGACDRLVEAFELQRVDFHGGRLHAVVLTPAGKHNERERVIKAVAFAAALREMIEKSGDRFAGRYRTAVRIGIDTGPAVAVNGGRRSEPEPLFIGSPANYAAHLAAGNEEGIFLSDRAARVLASSPVPYAFQGPIRLQDERSYIAEASRFASSSGERLENRLGRAFLQYSDQLKQSEELHGEPAVFNFHHHAPPLKSINFEEHPPSNAIRMEMASIFADLAGFTNYVDSAIAKGGLPSAVANLHVIRGELAANLRDDAGGRKVRFIGDCLHGILAEGSKMATDRSKTVETAVLSSGGLRSSFELCQAMLPGIGNLGLAIGIDLGWTPACRIGLRGDASVRCATSRATCESENEQQRCGGKETAIGQMAFDAGSAPVRRAFGHTRLIQNLNYFAAVALIEGIVSPAIHAEPLRAHQPIRAHYGDG